MPIVEKRNRSRTPHVEPELLEQGIRQLEMEIQILQSWLDHSDSTEEEHRRSYQDMLRSRHEMLRSLTEQKNRLQTSSSNAPPHTNTPLQP